MLVLETKRLALSHLSADDAPFIVRLLNDPDWIRFIGDRKIRTVDAALRYLREGPIAMYAREGFGLYRAALSDTGEPIGLCGLIRRPGLDAVDLGFAFLPAHRGKGYALESATGVVEHARKLGLDRLVAIASPDNVRSACLLTSLGFGEPEPFRLPGSDEDLHLFAMDLGTRPDPA